MVFFVAKSSGLHHYCCHQIFSLCSKITFVDGANSLAVTLFSPFVCKSNFVLLAIADIRNKVDPKSYVGFHPVIERTKFSVE